MGASGGSLSENQKVVTCPAFAPAALRKRPQLILGQSPGFVNSVGNETKKEWRDVAYADFGLRSKNSLSIQSPGTGVSLKRDSLTNASPGYGPHLCYIRQYLNHYQIEVKNCKKISIRVYFSGFPI
jgi:hypothetical protein